MKEIGISHATVQKNGSKIFLDEDPRQVMKRGKFQKLPILTGVTKDEGSMIIQGRIIKYDDSNLNSFMNDYYFEEEWFLN